MNSKDKCKVLKGIRKKIGDSIGVDLHQQECTFEGECTGTCSKCKHEENVLNKALYQKLGALTLGTVMGLSLTGCTLNPNEYDGIAGVLNPPLEIFIPDNDLSGDVVYIGDRDEFDNDDIQDDCNLNDCDDIDELQTVENKVDISAGVLSYYEE